MQSFTASLAAPASVPSGMGAKWDLYRTRYGAIHAATRFIATKAPIVWRVAGPAVSSSYRAKWLASSGPKVVNLGGGGNLIQGAITLDIDARADSYADLTKPLPFGDETIDAIFGEEIIEHIPKADAARLLVECLRVLKPGGHLRLATPDVDWIAATVLADGMTCDEFNANFYEHGHRYLYTRAEMATEVLRAGFSSVSHSTYKDPAAPLGFLDSHADRFHHDPLLSQYVDAVK